MTCSTKCMCNQLPSVIFNIMIQYLPYVDRVEHASRPVCLTLSRYSDILYMLDPIHIDAPRTILNKTPRCIYCNNFGNVCQYKYEFYSCENKICKSLCKEVFTLNLLHITTLVKEAHIVYILIRFPFQTPRISQLSY